MHLILNSSTGTLVTVAISTAPDGGFHRNSHALRVVTRSWEHHDGTCDKCGLQAIQDEKHALFLCPCVQMCSLRLQFANLPYLTFNLQTCFTISPKLVLKMSSILSRNKLMIPIVLSLSLWMIFLWLVFISNLNSQTTWLKVKLKLVNLNLAFVVTP